MNEIDNKLAHFFARHNFDIAGPSIDQAADALYYDAQLGLQTVATADSTAAIQEMLPTWLTVEVPTDKKVIVIDAGGTNLRSFLVQVKSHSAVIINQKKATLAAAYQNLSAAEFFESIAEHIDWLKDSANSIHICFGYAIIMHENNDASVFRMSKEVHVSGIEGALIGDSLVQALYRRGWKKPLRACVINDAAAVLLSGLSLGKEYAGYIGCILGTGFNVAYREPEPIPKLPQGKQCINQIVVCESAKTNAIVASDFDTEVQLTTAGGRLCKLEKMCGGEYLGKLISTAIHAACGENLFSSGFASRFTADFDFKTINEFLTGENGSENQVVKLCSTAERSDTEMLSRVSQAFITRAARIVAAELIAVALRTACNTTPEHPLCIVTEGTTFNKARNLQTTVSRTLYEHLTQKHGIYFELHSIENATAIGTAFISPK